MLAAENAGSRIGSSALSTDAEIERLARQWYNLVFPGEEAYAVLPPPAAGLELRRCGRSATCSNPTTTE